VDPSKKESRSFGVLDKVNFWIGNGDAKVSFIIGFTGVFLGFIFASDSITESIQNYLKTILEMSISDIKTILSLAGTVLFIFAIYYIVRAVYFLLKALKAKIDPSVYSETGLETDSTIFWGTIAKSDYATFKQKVDTIQDNALLNDIYSQIYINSKITTEKFANYNSGLSCLTRGIIFFVIFKLLTYLPF
jgi:hypothetical protein